LKGNRLYGLTATKEGITHSIRWKYSENDLLYGDIPEIRVRVFPRVRVFSAANDKYSVSSLYGDSLVNLDGLSDNKCIGIDQLGRYMCIDLNNFFILDELSDVTAVYSFGGLSTPNFGIQINSGRYIVSDPGYSRIIELDPTLTTILKTYTTTGCAYFDYSEENETLLITSETSSQIEEITWADNDNGSVIWQSSYAFNSPQCAAYKQGNNNKMIIADTGNNTVVKYSKDNDTYTTLNNYGINTEYTRPYEISMFKSPFRVYWYLDDNICVVEKQGITLNWDTVNSSSSSSGV